MFFSVACCFPLLIYLLFLPSWMNSPCITFCQSGKQQSSCIVTEQLQHSCLFSDASKKKRIWSSEGLARRAAEEEWHQRGGYIGAERIGENSQGAAVAVHAAE